MNHYQHKQTSDDAVFSENYLRTMWARGRFTLHTKEFEEFLQDYRLVTSREKELPSETEGETVKVLEWKTPETWRYIDEQLAKQVNDGYR
jgi:hypothetical protein